MKRFFLSGITILLAFVAAAQAGNKITIGAVDSIYSKVLNEQRNIWVYVPDNYQGGASNGQRYPVVYLLDGDAHFYSVVGMIQQLSQVNGNTICPEMIVVGITNTDRTRDLTPTHVAADKPFMDSAFSITSGGGENFIQFLEKELIPYVDSTYPTQPYKMLIGHSFGGLAAINILINHTKLFNAYISIDPSMWWDKMKYLETTKTMVTQKKFTGATLYIGIANTMDEGMNLVRLQKDTSGETRHIRSILELDKTLKRQTENGLRYAGKYYDNDDHGSVPMIATYDGLRFIFDKYCFRYALKDFSDSTVDLAGKFVKHYEGISKIFGYTVLPPESTFNGMGYDFLRQKQYMKAEKFFRTNTTNYPGSYNVYDSYGDYFMAIGNKTKAIENYKKALTLKENPDSREKLEKLLK